MNVSRLEPGRPPKVEIIDGTTVVTPDGGRTSLERPLPNTPCCDQPGLRYFGFARYAEGWLTLTSSDTPEVYHHTFAGQVEHRSLSWQVAGTSRNGRWAVVGGPRAFGPQGAELRWPSPGDGVVAGFVGPRRVLFSGGRGVYVGRSDGSVRSVPRWVRVFAASSAGPVAVGETRTGHRGVFAVPSGREVLDVQRLVEPFSFDPSGRLVAGAEAGCLCGVTVTEVGTGRTLLAVRGLSLNPDEAPYWEDRRNLLVVVDRFVVRVGLDGSLTLAYRSNARRHFVALALPRPRS